MIVLFRIVLFVTALGMIILGACLAFKNEPESAGIGVGSGIFLLFFVFLPEFEKFKGLGFEAKLKEKIKEADEALERLREFAPLIASMLFQMLNRLGRWSGPISRQGQFEFVENVKKQLKTMGISNDQIERLLEDTHKQIEFDMAFDLMNEPVHVLDTKMNVMPETPEKSEFIRNRNLFLEELQKIRKEWVTYRNTKRYELKMIDLVQGCELLDDREKNEINFQTQENAKDLEEYQLKRSFRRRDVWFNKGPA
jgi:hypothetical protein